MSSAANPPPPPALADCGSRRMRGRDIHEAHRVATPLELLFDLVFVVAIAQASAQLHHGVIEHHLASALLRFGMAFFAIWWAWKNYSWFASAYDTEDAPFRLLTLLQMVGVLIFATGIEGIFSGDFTAGVIGYAVMRVGLIAQWLRAARGDAARRRTCLRYAFGLLVVQLLWISRLALPPAWQMPSFLVFMLLDLAVPPWAERAGGTPWHAHHIAERYSLLAIIALGECVLGAVNALAGDIAAHGWSVDIGLLGLGSASLIFSLWWIYFLVPSADALHQHRERAFVWGYGSFFVFTSIAAIGAGLEVVADVLKTGAVAAQDAATAHGASAAAAHTVTPAQAIAFLASAQGCCLLCVWALYWYATRAVDRQIRLTAICLACIAAVVAAAYAGLPLPWALLGLSLGPWLAIAYNERGRRLRAAEFAVR